MSHPSSDSGRKNVLVVDSHEITREFLMRLIEGLGYHVIVAKSGADAVNLISAYKNDPFDLMVIEINMHELDGVEVAHYIRSLKMEMPVVFMSDGEPRYEMPVITALSPYLIRKPLTDIPAIGRMIRQAISAEVPNGTR